MTAGPSLQRLPRSREPCCPRESVLGRWSRRYHLHWTRILRWNSRRSSVNASQCGRSTITGGTLRSGMTSPKSATRSLIEPMRLGTVRSWSELSRWLDTPSPLTSSRTLTQGITSTAIGSWMMWKPSGMPPPADRTITYGDHILASSSVGVPSLLSRSQTWTPMQTDSILPPDCPSVSRQMLLRIFSVSDSFSINGNPKLQSSVPHEHRTNGR